MNGGTKTDGVCKANEPPPPPRASTIVDATATALDLYFAAYMVPIERREGWVDSYVLEAASSVNLGASAISQRPHSEAGAGSRRSGPRSACLPLWRLADSRVNASPKLLVQEWLETLAGTRSGGMSSEASN